MKDKDWSIKATAGGLLVNVALRVEEEDPDTGRIYRRWEAVNIGASEWFEVVAQVNAAIGDRPLSPRINPQAMTE